MNIDTEAIRRVRDGLLSHTIVEPSSQPSDAVLRRIEPFAEAMFLIMIADDEPASVERDVLIAAVNVLTDGRIAQPVLDAMVDGFQVNAERDGTEGRFARIGAILGADRDDRETAFTLAAAMALADDRVDLKENDALKWAQEYFGLSDRRVATLLDMMN